MFNRCSNCAYCGIDLKALQMGLYVHKCLKKKQIMVNPLWKGWRCKEWRKRNG